MIRRLVAAALLSVTPVLAQTEMRATTPPAPVHQEMRSAVAPDTALEMLMDGNQRYAEQHRTFPHQAAQRRVEISKRQTPFAVVLGCSDSRVPPELIFDQGLGDLFTVRLAGECCDEAALASIEYAVAHLNTRLIMVLGHEKCGAVDAALSGRGAEGHIPMILKEIAPAIQGANEPGHDKLDSAVRANVRSIAAKLRNSRPVLAELVKAGSVKVVGAEYDLDTGKVEILR